MAVSSAVSSREVYISFLRKKLAHIGANVRIRTIRMVGYCLEVGGFLPAQPDGLLPAGEGKAALIQPHAAELQGLHAPGPAGA